MGQDSSVATTQPTSHIKLVSVKTDWFLQMLIIQIGLTTKNDKDYFFTLITLMVQTTERACNTSWQAERNYKANISGLGSRHGVLATPLILVA